MGYNCLDLFEQSALERRRDENDVCVHQSDSGQKAGGVWPTTAGS